MTMPGFFDRDWLKTEDQRMRERSAQLDREQRKADNAPNCEITSKFGFRVEISSPSPAALARRAVCGSMAEQVVEWRKELIDDAKDTFIQSLVHHQLVGTFDDHGRDLNYFTLDSNPELLDFEGFHIQIKEMPLQEENAERFYKN